jgi:hypothetical protein
MNWRPGTTLRITGRNRTRKYSRSRRRRGARKPMLRHRPITVRITATTSVSAMLAAAYSHRPGRPTTWATVPAAR